MRSCQDQNEFWYRGVLRGGMSALTCSSYINHASFADFEMVLMMVEAIIELVRRLAAGRKERCSFSIAYGAGGRSRCSTYSYSCSTRRGFSRRVIAIAYRQLVEVVKLVVSDRSAGPTRWGLDWRNKSLRTRKGPEDLEDWRLGLKWLGQSGMWHV